MPSCRDVWLLVTAHPDDEAMFFVPTLRNLLAPPPTQSGDASSRVPVLEALCLSNGDYRDPSDGPIRAKELHRACSIIGIGCGKDAKAVAVLDDARMKDGPNEVWGPDVVAEAVLEHVGKRIAPAVCKDAGLFGKVHEYILSGPDADATHPWAFVGMNGAPPKAPNEQSIQSINLNILTFDKGGVSGHPNHVDTFKGVQHLLEEKCCISCDEASESRATLRLRQEAGKETTHNEIEVSVSVYTLRTITNPLHKYFLWAFVDILPYLVTRLFQTMGYLIYFLLGGLLWRSKGPQLQPFSGVTTFSNEQQMQCRIVEPILVWRAMAAHHSQFVWYRRLSVMFSRYTFVNDLQKLTIDAPIEKDDDEFASLPPVAVIEEEKPTTKFLLSTAQMNALREAVVTPNLRHRPWKRLYSLSRDGDSFVVFQKTMEMWNRQPGDTSSTLLIVKTSAGELIGGFADVPLIPTAEVVGSAARSCLFRIRTQNDGGHPIIDVYGKHSSATKRLVSSASRRMVAFGGGESAGELDEGFGLCLEDRFARGTTARCFAFDNEPLVCGQDGVFDVLDVEVWGFVFGQL